MGGIATTPPPIEPLSDVAWARVERGLWSRMDGPAVKPVATTARRWVWVAVPLFAVATVVVVVVARGSSKADPEIATTGSNAGDVRVVSPQTASTSASFDDAYIELEPASAVVMRHDHPATVLERGAAVFTVAPRGEHPPFVVVAGDATVRVIGTKFRVSRSDERIGVEVEHGIVEVQFHGSVVRLRDHERWSSEHPREAAPIQTAAATPAPDPIEMPVVPRQVTTPAKPDRIDHDKTPKTDKTPDTMVKPEAVDKDRVKFERLSTLETKNPTAAIIGYLELSQTSGRWAANALYAAARLAADREDPRAETLLTVYLRRFPTGANVDDARGLLAGLRK